VHVEFSEIALAGIRKWVPDPDRQQTVYAHLRWYLLRDGLNGTPCSANVGLPLFMYRFGDYRVLYSMTTKIIVWSFTRRATTIATNP
jgi:hypothetical protein